MSAGALARAAAALALGAAAGAPLAQGSDLQPPFVTTPPEIVRRMLELASVGAGDFLVDLGSGDGRIVIAAAREFRARGVGVEIDAELVELARRNAREAGVEARARFVVDDALQADLSRATVVTAYLLPEFMDRLQPKLLAELRPGARIVSHAFPMKGWAADRTETVPVESPGSRQGASSTLYLWVVPADVRGAWRASSAGGEWRLRIRQNFQRIEIEATLDGTRVPIDSAALTGRMIAWRAKHAGFGGMLTGEGIAGRLEAAGRAEALVFEREP